MPESSTTAGPPNSDRPGRGAPAERSAHAGGDADAPLWFRLDRDEVLDQLGADSSGLSDEEAARRLEEHGPNHIGEAETVRWWTVLLDQFRSPLIYVLIGALVVTLAIQSWADATVIGLVLVINATVGFLQEYKAESAVQSLMRMVAPQATVRRDGRERKVAGRDLAPGDIVVLHAGEVTPADVRLIEVRGLQTNEAALTGESTPVNKRAEALREADPDAAPADQINMAFMSTAVTAGNAVAVVVATGEATQIGRIAQQVRAAGETKTPLQERIGRLARAIAFLILGVAAVAVVIGWLMGRPLSEMLLLAVGLIVGAIPEGLPIVVTVALAIGVRRMADRNAVIRHLPAVDTLGSCTTIVSDKTGTLTENRMSVQAIFAGGGRIDVEGDVRREGASILPSSNGRHNDGRGDGTSDQGPSSRDAGEESLTPALWETLLVGVLCNEAEIGGGSSASSGDADTPRNHVADDSKGDGAPRPNDVDSGPDDEDDDQGGDEDEQGDPTEVALLHAGRVVGFDRADLLDRFPLIETIPFRTEERYMATVHEARSAASDGGSAERGDAERAASADPDGALTNQRLPILDEGEGPLVLVKGAPERVLEMCSRMRTAEGDARELDSDSVLEHSERLASEGLRMLAMAVGRGDEAVEGVQQGEISNLTFVGMQGLLDPPREAAVGAVESCHRAGIRVIMVTGDHATTASAIARRVGLHHPARSGPRDNERQDANRQRTVDQEPAQTSAGSDSPHDRDRDPSSEDHADLHALPGTEMARLDDEALTDRLRNTQVFARVKPEQKTRIVRLLKEQGEIVAVTGDGVNDAPALKHAHLGVAMGSGTDVAREASDMVITDDNFASVYAAVEEGRTAFRNIRMATFFLLSTGAAVVGVILGSLVFGWPLPLLPAQILWTNVVTNGIADVALAFERGDDRLFRRSPRPPSEGVLNRTLLTRLAFIGVWLTVGTLGVFYWKTEIQGGSIDEARMLTLTTLVLFQMVHVFNCRSEDVSIFRQNPFSNRLLFIGVAASLLVHIGATYLPWTQDLLSLSPMPLSSWLVAVGVALTAVIVNELHKWWSRRRANR